MVGHRSRSVGLAGVLACGALVLLLAGAPPGPASASEVDQYGREHDWSGPSDGYTVLDFAASWCAPCVESLPRLQELAREHPDVRFLVVSVDDKERGRDFLIRELGLDLPVIWDHDYRIAEHFAPEAMPATVVLGPDGGEVHRHVGFDARTWARFVELVESIDP